MSSDEIQTGDRVRVCHKTLRVHKIHRGSGDVTLRGELAGVHGQNIVSTIEYAKKHKVGGAGE